MKSINSVEEYIKKHDLWEKELEALREIALSTPLQETVKWGAPVYTSKGKNIVGLGAFKSYVGIWFFQGVFLRDPKKKLINAQENKTKAMRQWRFSSMDEIVNDSAIIKEYIKEAITNENKGKSIKLDRQKPVVIPKELELFLSENKPIKDKFDEISKGKQREYAEYITEAKRVETKQKRLEKIAPMILQGIGLNDKYKN
jgi:uncharacterized protein YdeI (YjbR/CyaY-like superfamily)